MESAVKLCRIFAAEQSAVNLVAAGKEVLGLTP
jgi:hypothetical protein